MHKRMNASFFFCHSCLTMSTPSSRDSHCQIRYSSADRSSESFFENVNHRQIRLSDWPHSTFHFFPSTDLLTNTDTWSDELELDALHALFFFQRQCLKSLSAEKRPNHIFLFFHSHFQEGNILQGPTMTQYVPVW